MNTRHHPSMLRQAVLTSLLALTCSGALTDRAHAQSGADLAPGDAGLFLELNDLSVMRKAFEKDPLKAYLAKHMPAEARKPNLAWVAITAALEMESAQVIDRYFGKSLVIYGEAPRDGAPAVLALKVSDADAKLALDRLAFQRQPQHDRQRFKVYAPGDNNAVVVHGLGWVQIGEKRAGKFIERSVDRFGKGASLAEDEAFRLAIASLPSDRFLTGYVRDKQGQERHAMSVSHLGKPGEGLALRYLGHSPKLQPILRELADGKANDFGPLPADTLAAITMNFKARPLHRNKGARVLDRMLAPKTFHGDVLPGLAGSTVLFWGQVDRDTIKPDPGIHMPAFGVAVKLKDKAVGSHITRVLNSLMMLANVGTIEWQTDAVLVSDRQHAGVSYRSANLGVALSQRTGRRELRPMTCTYGVIGDWYVLCTQEQFFQRCIDTHAGNAKPLAVQAIQGHAEGVNATSDAPATRPIASMVLRPKQLAAQLQSWVDHWRANPQSAPTPQGAASKPVDRKAVEGIAVVAGLARHFDRVVAQASQRGNTVHADLRVTRSLPSP